MYKIKNTKQSNISNLIIKKNIFHTLFDYTITYINETSFMFNVDFFYGEPAVVSFINKNDQNELINITINTSSNELITTPFKLIIDYLNSSNFYKVYLNFYNSIGNSP